MYSEHFRRLGRRRRRVKKPERAHTCPKNRFRRGRDTHKRYIYIYIYDIRAIYIPTLRLYVLHHHRRKKYSRERRKFLSFQTLSARCDPHPHHRCCSYRKYYYYTQTKYYILIFSGDESEVILGRFLRRQSGGGIIRDYKTASPRYERDF